MNIFISLVIAVSGAAAFIPSQLPKEILRNPSVENDEASASGRIFFAVNRNKVTSITAVTVTSTTGTYSTCYCSVTPLTACPTNRKKRQMPWILTEPYAVQQLPFAISGSQPFMAADFNSYPWAPVYNWTNHRAAIMKFPQNPVVKPQWPLRLMSFERAQVLPVDYSLQANENIYGEGFFTSNPRRLRPELRKQPEDLSFPNDGSLYSEPDVESSLSQGNPDVQGRAFFGQEVVTSTFTVTSYVSTLAGTQQVAIACLAPGANFPGPRCTNNCPTLFKACTVDSDCKTTAATAGICSAAGVCKCSVGMVSATTGKCVVCSTTNDCTANAAAVAVCSAGVCECTKGLILTTGKCSACTINSDCLGNRTPVIASSVCSTSGICGCAAPDVLNRDTGKCDGP